MSTASLAPIAEERQAPEWQPGQLRCLHWTERKPCQPATERENGAIFCDACWDRLTAPTCYRADYAGACAAPSLREDGELWCDTCWHYEQGRLQDEAARRSIDERHARCYVETICGMSLRYKPRGTFMASDLARCCVSESGILHLVFKSGGHADVKEEPYLSDLIAELGVAQ